MRQILIEVHSSNLFPSGIREESGVCSRLTDGYQLHKHLTIQNAASERIVAVYDELTWMIIVIMITWMIIVVMIIIIPKAASDRNVGAHEDLTWMILMTIMIMITHKMQRAIENC